MRTALPLAALLLAGCPLTDKPDTGGEDTAAAETRTATFDVKSATEIDVLFVVDDSVSMMEEQANLAVAIPEAFEGWGAAAVHIGFTTTSLEGDPDDAVITWFDLACADDPTCLGSVQGTARPGTAGDDQERGFEAAITALSSPLAETTNAGFARPGSLKVIVPFSDEEDCSGNTGATGEDCYTDGTVTPVRDLVWQLWNVDPAGRVQVSGIYGIDWTACSAVVPSTRYAQAVELTGGAGGDICDPTYDATLAAITAAAVAPPDRFRLPEDIDTARTTVTLDGVLVPEDANDGWSWDAILWQLTLTGTWRPAEGDVVQITYVPA